MYVKLAHFQNPLDMDDEYQGLLDIPDEFVNGSRIQQRNQTSLLFNQQAGHSSRTANKHYAFSTNDFSYMAKDNLQNFYMCSLEWHELLRK